MCGRVHHAAGGRRLALLCAALVLPAAAVVTTTSSETSDAAQASAGLLTGAVCGVIAPACSLAVSAADATLAGTYDVTGCRQGRPVYTRRAQAVGDPPRLLAWVASANASDSLWVVTPALVAPAALLRSNAPHLAGGFQAHAAWARPDWLTAEDGHAVWVTGAGSEAPDVVVGCMPPARVDTASTLLAASAAGGCTTAERDACELVITASGDDPLVALSGPYPLAGCMGGRPLYTRAATTITPTMHIAFLVRAGGVWAVTSSTAPTAAPAAVLLPNPGVWTALVAGASRPDAVAVSYTSYAHDRWLWSAWPVAAATRLNTSVAALPRLPALPSPSFIVLCAQSDFSRSPPPSAPPAPPRAAGPDETLRRPAALGGLIAGLVVAAVLALLAAALLYRRHLAAADGDGDGSSSGFNSSPKPPWWSMLHTRSDEVVLGPLLGHGGYATVHAATWRCSPVAAKVLHTTVRQQSATINAALAKEVLLMSRIRHPNVLSVFGFCLKPPMLLLELGTRGSLAALLKHPTASAALGWRERCRLAHGVACGLAFLHAPEPPIVHLDVKCENVVLDDGMCPKVSDFGLSSLLLQIAPPPAEEGAPEASAQSVSYRLRARGCGTPLYSAPEVDSKDTLQLPLALDVYCFGSAILHPLAHQGTTALVGEFSTPLYRFFNQQRTAVTSALMSSASPSAAMVTAASTLAPDSDTLSNIDVRWGPLQTLVARELLGWQPEIAPRCPPPLADAIRRCCVMDPAVRPRMDALRDEMQALLEQADSW